jgi:hypothetical protein
MFSSRTRALLLLAFIHKANKINIDEKLHENIVFDSGCSGLHGFIRGRQAELQKDRQELSDE